MALFSNSKEQPMAKQVRVNGGAPGHVNMIGEGTVLEGTLQSDGDVRVSGRLVGTLKVGGKVSIAQEGVVDGEVYATNADIAGRVEGELHIEERLLLTSTARVEGNIRAARLVMEEGAAFNGKSEMGSRSSVQPPKAAPSKNSKNGVKVDDKPPQSAS
jgi:cytoskeletal protein CcmA (bactofilin family)